MARKFSFTNPLSRGASPSSQPWGSIEALIEEIEAIHSGFIKLRRLEENGVQTLCIFASRAEDWHLAQITRILSQAQYAGIVTHQPRGDDEAALRPDTRWARDGNSASRAAQSLTAH